MSGWLKALRSDWPTAVVRLLEQTPSVVRVVIASMRGSSPRETGACLLVWKEGIEGTIGGGHLEWDALRTARELLDADDSEPAVHIRRLILGRELGQCCGGTVQLWFERLTQADLPLLTAASHAAQSSDSALLESDFDGVRVTRWLIDASSPESMRLLKTLASQIQEHSESKRAAVTDLRSALSGKTRPVAAHSVPNATRGQSSESNGQPSSANHPLPVAASNVPAVACGQSGESDGQPPLANHALPESISSAGEIDSLPRVRFTQTAAHAGTLLEQLHVSRQDLWLFGAGHVGQAVVRALSELPYQITWVDSRADLLPTKLPAHIHTVHRAQHLDALSHAPPGALYLVLTHDHGIDYELCRAILNRGDFAWLGLIGSESKGARFRSRLHKDGLGRENIERLVCPIGVDGIESKEPAAIAIGVAAQLLRLSADASSKPRTVPKPQLSSHAKSAAGNEASSDIQSNEAWSGNIARLKFRMQRIAIADGACDCTNESCDGCSHNTGKRE